MSALRAYLDSLIPDALREPLDIYFRSRVLVSMSLWITLTLFPFLLVRGLWQGFDHPYTISIMFVISILMITPRVLEMFASLAIGGGFMIFSLTLATILMCVFDGGIYSPTVFWFPLLPLFGIFFAGFRFGFFIAGLLSIATLVFLLSEGSTWIQPGIVETPYLKYLYFGSVISIGGILFILVYLFTEWQRAATQELYEASMAKNEFLSGVSHELRTPLNAIMGFSEVLQKGYAGELNEQQEEQVGYIMEGSEHLLGLVDELLDISAIESGRVDFQPTRLEALPVIHACLKVVESAAQTKGINLTAGRLEEVEFVVDEVKFKQILINLLSNALKFTDPGGRVTCQSYRDAGNLVIMVSDTGRGIPAEAQEKIFEKFYQAQRSMTEKSEGSGLGLFISKTFAGLHGGDLRLSASGDSGSSFELVLPLDGDVRDGETARKR